MEKELLTARETSEITGWSVQHLADMRWRNEGPPYIKLAPGKGGAVRYPRTELMAWIKARIVYPEKVPA
ncbi:Helix-turn-helix domain-containing protein [Streptomyces sp. WMMB 714]|uniref:helix-turn-helix transcriptional regulator n=1 Tax=Streptomyces sp. WMMB 714 TaxID=1286822 RepID=UPI000696EA03|nr:helix-turn-helix domain-containing protein [Streptomyces sp. WMMB 714]SCK37236.1 Helix-turn-helix domain-containing protein [Streptomyces sp. WMMB 714]